MVVIVGHSDFCALHKCRILGKRSKVAQPTAKYNSSEAVSTDRTLHQDDDDDKVCHFEPHFFCCAPSQSVTCLSRAQAYETDRQVNQGQRGGATTVVAAVYGAGHSGAVRLES